MIGLENKAINTVSKRIISFSTTEAIASWAARDETPRLLVDRHGATTWMNAAAKLFVQNKGQISLRDGKICARQSLDEEALQRLLRTAGAHVSGICLSSGGTGELVVVTAVAIDFDDRDLLGLTLHRTTDVSLNLVDLKGAFGVTHAEMRVAANLLDGRPAEQTATHLNLSLDTVRSHIRSLYSKLGVGSREGLFRKLLPFAVISRGPPAVKRCAPESAAWGHCQ